MGVEVNTVMHGSSIYITCSAQNWTMSNRRSSLAIDYAFERRLQASKSKQINPDCYND